MVMDLPLIDSEWSGHALANEKVLLDYCVNTLLFLAMIGFIAGPKLKIPTHSFAISAFS